MNKNELINHLRLIYPLFLEHKDKEAEVLFSSLKIVDSQAHLNFPKPLRHIIWDLHEFLVVGDINQVTDRDQILSNLREIFSEYK